MQLGAKAVCTGERVREIETEREKGRGGEELTAAAMRYINGERQYNPRVKRRRVSLRRSQALACN